MTQFPIIHVRLTGLRVNVPLRLLRITANSRDMTIRQAVANYFGVPTATLATYRIIRYPNGNMVLHSVKERLGYGQLLPTPPPVQ